MRGLRNADRKFRESTTNFFVRSRVTPSYFLRTMDSSILSTRGRCCQRLMGYWNAF